tara:strand:+ start:432 stop:923 length:492 start_codon:yes stop_codon:yes gene_type:complete
MNDKHFFICGDKFLSKKTCDSLITYFKKNQQRKEFHRDNSTFFVRINNKIRFFLLKRKIKNLMEKYTKEKVLIDEMQIVEWPENSEMIEHYDIKNNDFCAVIIYLNETFSGGETIFNLYQKSMVVPVTGRFVLFSNRNILHSVNQVSHGKRYTLACYTTLTRI